MSAVERVKAAYVRITEVDRPEVWVTLRPRADALADAAVVDARVAAGEQLLLAGTVAAVKDNIDVAGLPTTAACPAFAYDPAVSAPAAQRLLDAGAVVIGKTNLDQFATGLVGTRTPYGAMRDARRPDRVAGGSSSGSAVAVALGIVDVALGTDTAGSGRVPAAFGGVVGIKPTRGLVPTRGVVPACPSYDCVTTFAATLELAGVTAQVIADEDVADPNSRVWPADAPLAAPPRPRVAVPRPEALEPLSDGWRYAFEEAAKRLKAGGAHLVEIDVTPFLQAARMLYEGAFVAERYASVGVFIDAHPDEVDPTVRAIVSAARDVPAHQLVTDGLALGQLRLAAMAAIDGCHALLLPTTTSQPAIADVQADPLAINARLGTFTNFANLLDLCAVAVPAGEADGGCFGVTVLARAFHDAVATDVACLLLGETPAIGLAPPGLGLVVVGAHLSGMVLNDELTCWGARLVGAVRTAPDYRLYALRTTPPRPGLVRVAEGGATVEAELWQLPPAGLASLLDGLPPSLSIGRVRLQDGSRPLGFLCQSASCDDAPDITHHGGWRDYLECPLNPAASAAVAGSAGA